MCQNVTLSVQGTIFYFMMKPVLENSPQIRIEVNFMELKFWSRNKAHILAPEIKDYSALQCSNPGLKLPFLILSFTALFRAGTKTTDFDIL